MALADRLKPWHRRNAFLLIVFLTLHLVTHLAAIFGPETHGSVIDLFRLVYRAPTIEIGLIGLFISQVGLGFALVWPRLRQADKPLWSWVQIVSGLYLAIFILNHIFLGILRGRTYDGIETGFYFVASTLITAPIRYGFIPYYFLAILAVLVHLAAALYWAGKSKALIYGLIAAGLVAAALITASYSGLFFPIELPDAYKAYIREAF